MCRRCSECANYSHHWILDFPFEEPDEDEYLDHPDFCCKHCNAIGDSCPECYGDGIDPNDNSTVSGDPAPCQNCNGEGVILVGGGDVVYSRKPEDNQ